MQCLQAVLKDLEFRCMILSLDDEFQISTEVKLQIDAAPSKQRTKFPAAMESFISRMTPFDTRYPIHDTISEVSQIICGEQRLHELASTKY